MYNADDMIQIRLKEILEERKQSLYSFSQQTGIRYATVWALSHGEVKRIPVDILDRICKALECQPGEILIRLDKATARKRSSAKARLTLA